MIRFLKIILFVHHQFFYVWKSRPLAIRAKEIEKELANVSLLTAFLIDQDKIDKDLKIHDTLHVTVY